MRLHPLQTASKDRFNLDAAVTRTDSQVAASETRSHGGEAIRTLATYIGCLMF